MSPKKSSVRHLLALGALALAFASGCELFETIQSEKVLAGTVLSTPEYDFSAALVPDGGYPAGVDAGIEAKVGPKMIAQVFFGDRDSQNPTAAPEGSAGAKVSLAIGGKSFELEDKGSGNYSLSTVSDPEFLYVSGAEVKLTIVQDGQTYTADVTAPQEEKIAQFHAKPGEPLNHPANTELELTRSSNENVAFTTVMPASESAQDGVTYTDIPQDALGLLDLVANDGKWRTEVITIPGDAFKEAGKVYVVNVSAVKKGSTSNNLFTTSAFMVGTADIGVVKAQ